MNKEYGKLTEDQFRRLVRQLPEFRREYAGMKESIRSASPKKLREVLGERRRRAEAIRQEEVRQRAQELERRKNLLAEAVSWRDASLIRDYIAHIEHKLGQSNSDIQPELAEWLVWAEQVADEIDPTRKWAVPEEGRKTQYQDKLPSLFGRCFRQLLDSKAASMALACFINAVPTRR